MYTPEPLPFTEDAQEYFNYLHRELSRLSAALTEIQGLQMVTLNTAPDRPREGMIAWADGVNWSPRGDGAGLYQYSGGKWNSLAGHAYVEVSATLDFASIASNSTGTLTVTVTGATVGDTVVLGPPSTIEAGLIWCGYVSATNTVTIRLHNPSGGAIDPASASWRVGVFFS